MRSNLPSPFHVLFDQVPVYWPHALPDDRPGNLVPQGGCSETAGLLLKGGDTWGDISFTDDKRDQSLFSPLNKANIDNILAKKQPTPGPIIQLISLGFNILSQTRETRLQMDANLYVLKWTLASCLLPQLTLLLLLCLQWVITRRKQGKLKKQIRKAEENHQMVARIRGQNPWREQSRFVEV